MMKHIFVIIIFLFSYSTVKAHPEEECGIVPPVPTCPTRDDLFYINEGGGGLCTTGQASVQVNPDLLGHVNWRWALGGYSGTVPNAGTTTPIYYPSGDWTNYYIAIYATLVTSSGVSCPEVSKSFLLNCGTGPGGPIKGNF
jgi:hypothetical protein